MLLSVGRGQGVKAAMQVEENFSSRLAGADHSNTQRGRISGKGGKESIGGGYVGRAVVDARMWPMHGQRGGQLGRPARRENEVL